MTATIEGNQIIIRAEIANPAPVSSTGKSRLLVNTQGFVKTGLVHDGKPVSVSVNVIIPTK